MDFILYGASGDNYYPEIGFTQEGDGSVSIEFEGDYILRLDELDDRSVITWRDLAFWGIGEKTQEEVFSGDPGAPFVHLVSEEKIKNPPYGDVDHLDLFRAVIRHLSELLQSEPERKFFHLYAKRCVDRASPGPFEDSGLDAVKLWKHTALIPQVWVNWFGNSSTGSERGDTEPFRVDFLLNPPDQVSPNLSIVEIDGKTHFTTSGLDDDGNRQYHHSMERYTEHVRKDRWLRKQGYDVVRFANQEVRELADAERGAKKVKSRLFDTLRKMSGAWS